MSGDKPAASNPLEQFLLLMKNARGAAAVSVLTQALEAPNVYVFGELLDMPNVQEVCSVLLSWVIFTMVLMVPY